jgi:hypothetical protein
MVLVRLVRLIGVASLDVRLGGAARAVRLYRGVLVCVSLRMFLMGGLCLNE